MQLANTMAIVMATALFRRVRAMLRLRFAVMYRLGILTDDRALETSDCGSKDASEEVKKTISTK